MRPFGELFPESPRRRSSIQVQFTPMTARTERSRLSVSAKHSVNYRVLMVCGAIFLFASGAYKSGLLGWLMKVRSSLQITPEVPLPEDFVLSTSAFVMDKRASSVIVDPEVSVPTVDEYISTSAVVPNVVEAVPEYSIHIEAESVALSLYESSLVEIARLTALVGELTVLPPLLKTTCTLVDQAREEKLQTCSDDLGATVVGLHAAESFAQTCVSEKSSMQTELVSKFNEELLVRNLNIQNLETRLQQLERDNSNLNNQLALEATPAVPVIAPTPDPDPLLRTDQTLLQSSVVVVVLTVWCLVMTLCSCVLFMMLRSSRDVPLVELLPPTTAVPFELPSVTIEELDEARPLASELGAILKDLLCDSSTRAASPETPARWEQPLAELSLENSLEHSLTPIRVPLLPCVLTAGSSSPVRFSIASPMRKDASDGSDTDQENVNFASIFDNFNAKQ